MLDGALLACSPDETLAIVAADMGAVDNVIPISALPRGRMPDDVVERHAVGASDAHMEAYGGCDTLTTTWDGQMACTYKVADVAGTLRLISRTTGSFDGPGT